MGWKISNRHFEVEFKNIESIFSHILARRCESSLWDFHDWEKFLTRFLSIFVCFTPPLIFPEPLKLARWNFQTRCIDDGANWLISHSCLAPIGAKEGGSKNGVNFGIFKNHSGGHRGGQISTDRSQIYIRGGVCLVCIFFRTIISGNYHSRFHFRFPAKIPVTLWYINTKFTEHVDTLSGCRKEFSKSEVTPKFGPQGGSNF